MNKANLDYSSNKQCATTGLGYMLEPGLVKSPEIMRNLCIGRGARDCERLKKSYGALWKTILVPALRIVGLKLKPKAIFHPPFC